MVWPIMREPAGLRVVSSYGGGVRGSTKSGGGSGGSFEGSRSRGIERRMWHDGFAEKDRGHDFASTAQPVVEQAIGERIDGSPLPPPANSKQVAGAKGGQLGQRL